MRSLRNLTPEARRSMLKEEGAIDSSFATLQQRSLADWAARLDDSSENVIGSFPMPLSAVRIRVNGRDRVVPLVTEEKGVVAGIAKATKYVNEQGFVGTAGLAHAEAQILLCDVPQRLLGGADNALDAEEEWAIQQWMEKQPHPFARYGGSHHRSVVLNSARRVNIPVPGMFHERGDRTFLELKIRVGAAEAMGAKVVTRIGEELGRWYAERVGATFVTAIVANGWTGRYTAVRAEWPLDIFTDEAHRQRFRAISCWPWKNRDRAATHVKGIMNGIHDVGTAFGQDLRAIDAAAASPMFREVRGRVPHLTQFNDPKDSMVGELEMLLPSATVGGATQHPMVAQCRQMAGITDAADLAAVMAAVGLAANFASLCQLSDPNGFSDTYRKLEKRP